MKKNSGRPILPPPLVNQPLTSQLPVLRTSQEAKRLYQDVIEHPWFLLQPDISELSWEIIEDIRSLERLDIPFYQIHSAYLSLQKEIEVLGLHWPNDLYQIINLPLVKNYPTPLPFRIYRRMLVSENMIGFPVYLDVRVFDLSSEEDAQKIMEWHFQLLEKGKIAFQKTAYSENALIGRGDRNPFHFDPSHGIATKDRGIFLAPYLRGKRLYLLYADTSWQDLSLHLDTFLNIVAVE